MLRALATKLLSLGSDKTCNQEENCNRTTEEYGKYVEGLPDYTLEDVANHRDEGNGIWVIYNNGVYDISSYIKRHPGGKIILYAACGPLEPFWSIYTVHYKPTILAMIEKFRIGNLAKDQNENRATSNTENPYADEPQRHSALNVRASTPFCGEPPPELLVQNFITPAEIFYVANHLPVPDISEQNYALEVVGLNGSTLNLSLADLKTKFLKNTITATLHCTGNRGSEMDKLKPVTGIKWTQGAIGNAVWSGARLRDVLLKVGIDDTDDVETLHVQFEGADSDPTSTRFGVSIPLEKAINPRGDVLLAYEMNGEPLPRDHGYPVRVVIPGTAGARWVKWLRKIVVSREESETPWQRNDYKGFSPSSDWDKIDYSEAAAIQELPVTSAICTPQNGETVSLEDGKVNLKGYAWSGGGRRIVRVDVSVDQGKTWHVAHLMDPQSQALNRQWAWTRWQLGIPVEKEGELDAWVRAVDSSYNVQPETMADIWNKRGLVTSCYHKIKIRVQW